MRRPTEIECLYLDFDGFFASVEQTVHPELRGKPVGVVPFKYAPRRRRNCYAKPGFNKRTSIK